MLSLTDGKHPRPGGFSLIEVVVALGILSFALIPMIALLPSGLTSFRNAQNLDTASLIASQIQADAQSSTFSQYTTARSGNNSFAQYYDNFGHQVSASDPTCVYTATVSWQPLSTTQNSLLAHIDPSISQTLQVAIAAKGFPTYVTTTVLVNQ